MEIHQSVKVPRKNAVITSAPACPYTLSAVIHQGPRLNERQPGSCLNHEYHLDRAGHDPAAAASDLLNREA